ncbi:PPC domain-containing protein, partial [Singulisphaera rosea]
AFTVGDWPEASEANEPEASSERPQPLTLPVVVNGRIDRPTDVDAYVFSAKKGRRVLIDAWAERVDSALDATIKVVDPSGKELAYSGDSFGKDPFLDFTVPEDGDYTISVWDFVYDGGPDSVYRLQVGSLPHLDAVVPLAVRPGESTKLTLLGRNIPGGTPTSTEARPGQGGMLESLDLEGTFPTGAPASPTLRGGQSIRPPQSTLDGFVYRLKTSSGSSNPIFLGVTELPVAIEREPNGDRAKAQTLEVPSEVSGTFAPVGDSDFYTFRTIKGQEVVFEVFGERQSGLIDPFLAGYDPSGRRIFSADDGALREIGQL